MLVGEIMTRRAEAVAPGETLEAAARQMKACGVGALVVCEGDRPVGILTDRDIVVRCVAEGGNPARADVRSAMTPQVVECGEEDALEDAVRRMAERAVRRLVVLDASRRLAGVLSVDDVARRAPALAGAVVEHLQAPERPLRQGPWPWWETPGR
jgi:CBS domain-containing protein